jgi:hypothetical protein
MDNPLLRKLAKRDHGERGEKKTTKRLGGRQQPASGAMDHSKGDIKLADFLVENKTTINESLSLKLEWLRKISDESIALNREPAVAIQFVDHTGRPVTDGTWILVPERVFKEFAG